MNPVSPRPSPSSSNAAKGLGFFLVGMMALGVLDAIAKLLMRSYHPFQITWGRFFFAFVIVIPWVIRLAARSGVTSRRPGLQILRAAVLAAANYMFFLAISSMQLAEVQAISFISPLLVTALAALVLRERVGPRRWAAVAIGLLGVAVILRPSGGMLHTAALFALGQAIASALFHLITRFVAAHDPPEVTFIFTALVGTILASIAVPFVWNWPSPTAWALMALTGAIAAFGHWCLIEAYRWAEASSLAPYMYLALPWVTFLGWAAFGELPDGWTFVGAGIVIASGIYVFTRERHLRRIGRL